MFGLLLSIVIIICIVVLLASGHATLPPPPSYMEGMSKMKGPELDILAHQCAEKKFVNSGAVKRKDVVLQDIDLSKQLGAVAESPAEWLKSFNGTHR